MPDSADAHAGSIRDEFAHQADSFAANPVAHMSETLDAVVDLVPEDAAASWIELACGPAAISRALARRVGRVQGVDLTPEMIAKANAEAARAGVENLSFALGDATALDFEDDSFDGAVTRFSLHHIPAPQRVVEEMARVVRPGGLVVIADFVTDEDCAVAAWHEQIERLRDPSHWACLTSARLLATGERAGLTLDSEQLIPFEIDYTRWLDRGSGGPANAALIDRLLAEAPANVASFLVSGEGAERRLTLRNSVTRWIV